MKCEEKICACNNKKKDIFPHDLHKRKSDLLFLEEKEIDHSQKHVRCHYGKSGSFFVHEPDKDHKGHKMNDKRRDVNGNSKPFLMKGKKKPRAEKGNGKRHLAKYDYLKDGDGLHIAWSKKDIYDIFGEVRKQELKRNS